MPSAGHCSGSTSQRLSVLDFVLKFVLKVYTLLCSFVQAQAAAQAGVSVIQPNVGRIMDWYRKHPGYIKHQKVSLHVCNSGVQLWSCCWSKQRVSLRIATHPLQAVFWTTIVKTLLEERVVDTTFWPRAYVDEHHVHVSPPP